MRQKLVIHEILSLAKRGWWLLLAFIALPIVSDVIANYITTYLGRSSVALVLSYGLLFLLIIALLYVAAEAILESKTRNIIERFSRHLEEFKNKCWDEQRDRKNDPVDNYMERGMSHLERAMRDAFNESSSELGYIKRAGIGYRMRRSDSCPGSQEESPPEWHTAIFHGKDDRKLENILKSREKFQCEEVTHDRQLSTVHPEDPRCPFDSLFLPLSSIDGLEAVLFFHKEHRKDTEPRFQHQSTLESVASQVEKALRDTRQWEQLAERATHYETKFKSALPDGAMTYPAFYDYLGNVLTEQEHVPPSFFLAAVTLVMPFSNAQILEINRLLVQGMQAGPAVSYGMESGAAKSKAAKVAQVGSRNNVKLMLVPGTQEFVGGYIQYLRDEVRKKPVKVGDLEMKVDIAAGIVACSCEDLSRTDRRNLPSELVDQALLALEEAERVHDDLKVHCVAFEVATPLFDHYGQIRQEQS